MRRRDFLPFLVAALPAGTLMAGVPPEAYFAGGTAPSAGDYYAPAPVAPASLLPKVTFFGPTWCSGCQQLERAFAGNTDFDATFVHDESKFPSWVNDGISKGLTYPVAYWEVTPGKWRWYFGVNSVADFKQHWKACDKNPTINTAKAPVRHVSRSLHYGTYQSVYDWPGDLRQHLTHSPHNYDSGYVYGLSDQQCISLHDNWHLSHDGGRASNRRGLIGRVFAGRRG